METWRAATSAATATTAAPAAGAASPHGAGSHRRRRRCLGLSLRRPRMGSAATPEGKEGSSLSPFLQRHGQRQRLPFAPAFPGLGLEPTLVVARGAALPEPASLEQGQSVVQWARGLGSSFARGLDGVPDWVVSATPLSCARKGLAFVARRCVRSPCRVCVFSFHQLTHAFTTNTHPQPTETGAPDIFPLAASSPSATTRQQQPQHHSSSSEGYDSDASTVVSEMGYADGAEDGRQGSSDEEEDDDKDGGSPPMPCAFGRTQRVYVERERGEDEMQEEEEEEEMEKEEEVASQSSSPQ